jgi:hypothetical protein
MAVARGHDAVLVDTAGRLHTKTNLMAELAKMARVAGKEEPGAPHETLLVLDASTGQNGVAQARAFTDAVEVTGVVLTKMDGTALTHTSCDGETLVSEFPAAYPPEGVNLVGQLYAITDDNGWHYNYPPTLAILLVPLAGSSGGTSVVVPLMLRYQLVSS